MDVRTFRIGSFGFGDFTQNVTVQRAFIQVNGTDMSKIDVQYCYAFLVMQNSTTYSFIRSFLATSGRTFAWLILQRKAVDYDICRHVESMYFSARIKTISAGHALTG